MRDPEQMEEQLERYILKESSPAETAAVEEWLHDNVASPECDAMFGRVLDKTPVDVDMAGMRRVWRRLEQLPGMKETPRRSWAVRIAGRAAEYAAVAALALILFLKPAAGTAEWCEEYVAHGENRRIELPDGSQIWLNSGSRLFYPSRFADSHRTVYIDGEIFADVAKDPDRPFVVSASGVKIRVLGTRFSLKSYADDPNVELALMQGSVALETEGGGEAALYTLDIGEMVRYRRSDGAMESYDIDLKTYGTWYRSRNLCFVNQTLGDIVADLERRFDVRIMIENRELADTKYYSSFVNDETLEQILKALNSGNTMRIDKHGEMFVISRRQHSNTILK